MKYSLIVGYSTTEMHKSYPTCRISIDDRLITEFDCDNESLSNINFDFTLTILSKKGKQVQYSNVCSTNKSFLTPCKFHVIEIDSSNLRNDMPIILELSNNPSNYNNGFVTKRNMVCFRPIYLIPNNLLYGKDKLKKFLKKSHLNSKDIVDARKSLKNHTKWNWPGFYDGWTLDYHGGNTRLSFTVKKKQNFFFLEHTLPEILEIKGQNRSKNNWGFPSISSFFYAWIDFFTKSFSEHKCVLETYRLENGKYDFKLESYEIITTLQEKSHK